LILHNKRGAVEDYQGKTDNWRTVTLADLYESMSGTTHLHPPPVQPVELYLP